MSQHPPGGYYGGTHPLPGGDSANGVPHYQGYYDPRYYPQANPGYPPAPYGVAPYGQPVYPQGYPISNPAPHIPPAAPYPVQYATRPPASQPAVKAAEAPPQLGTWFPDADGYLLIEEWLRELDPQNSGSVGGGPVVKFLSRSNLPKETLREIWAVVDSTRSGKLSKNQFITVLRFVAVLCSPIYMGSKPTVELFNSTLKKDIPLPSQLRSVPEAPPKPVEPEAAAVTAPSTVPPPATQAVPSVGPAVAHSAIPHGTHAMPAHQAAPYPHAGYPPQALSSLPGYGYHHPYPVRAAPSQIVTPQPSHPPHPGYGMPHPHLHGDASAAHQAAGYDPRAYSYSPQPLQSSTPPPPPLPTATASATTASNALLHQFPQSAHGLQLHQPAESLGAKHENGQEEEDEEFSDFASAQPTPLPSVPSAPSPTPAVALPAMEAATFTSGSSATVGIAIQSPSDIDDEDAFGPLTSSPLPPASKSILSKSISADSEDVWEGFTGAAEPSTAPVVAAEALVSISQSLHSSSSFSSSSGNNTEKDDPATLVEGQPVAPLAAPQAAPLPTPSMLPAQGNAMLSGNLLATAQAATGRGRLSVFDELVEQDMQGLQEDWDDFADSSSAAPPLVTPSTAELSKLTHTAAAIELLSEAPAAQTAAPLNPFDLLDDLPPEPVVSLDLIGGHSSMDGKGALPPPSLPSFAQTGVDDADHNEFGDFSAAPTTAASEMTPREDPPAIQIETAFLAENDEAEFGNFESHSPISAPPALSSFVPAEKMAPSLPPPSFAEDDEDFGDFSQAQHAPSDAASVMSAPAAAFVEDDLLLMMDMSPTSSSTTALPRMPSHAATSASHSLLDLLSDPLPSSAPLPVVQNFNSLPPVSSVPSSLEVQPFAAFEDAPFDPFATGPVPTGSQDTVVEKPALPSNFEAMGSSTNFTGSAAKLASVPPLVSHSTSTKPSSSLPPKGARAHSATGSGSSSSSSGTIDHSSGGAAPMGIAELESLANALARKRLYEDAYACARQVSILQRLQALTFQKAQAMENDDLETALQLKKAAVVLASELQPQEREAQWLAASRSNRSGDSLNDMEESIALFDEVLSKKFHKLFVTTAPAASMGLEANMRHAILAKRSSRMAVITCSSHPNHPKYWQRLLKAMFSKLQQASTVTKKAFAQLSSADQRAVLGTSKMSEYVCGLERLAEATLWVAATCSEAMLYEAESASAWKLAQDVLKMLATTYQQEPSKYLGISREDISLSAEQATEMANMTTTYCSLSLRPLQSTPKAAAGDRSEQGEQGVDATVYYPHQETLNKLTFMQPLVSIWLHDVDKALPAIDSAFC